MARPFERPLILNRYRPLETRGEGGFGVVDIAWDTRLQRRVAIKRIPLQAIGSDLPGIQEARTAAMLNDAGGVIDDLIIYFINETRFRIVINAGTALKDLDWIQAKVAEWQLDVTITQRRDGNERRHGQRRPHGARPGSVSTRP